jgi:ABC-2 type transport system permease protein
MNTSVLRAVFFRNFVSYFASPTGYVFIWVFVALSTSAAFLPNEFFNANLANLDQLNKVFPIIMLVFIPAITMSIWAEERREGTDELLLTIPASDFDVVLGKYLAAVAIFTVSLLFSLVSNYLVLISLGNPDVGLMLGTYLGYWLVGLAMLALGMVASFLTRNLTVAYILGALFNLPLVFAAWSDAVLGPEEAALVTQSSIPERFADFGRGVVSFTSVIYFVSIVVVTAYVSMVLIGRRHWSRGWVLTACHYLCRGLALAVIACSAVVLAQRHEIRYDTTSEKLTSLAPQTRQLLENLPDDRQIRIEAFVSPAVPEGYVQTRMNLINTLREMQALGGEKILLEINETEPFTEEASRAEQRFKIVPRKVATMERGALSVAPVFMGVAFRCGLNSITLPFIDRGVPLEYELVRSISTVTEQQRKTVGVLTTDAPLYGRFDMRTMSPVRNWPIIDELEKQYDVVRVDPTQPITKKYDVLLAVQPSSLGPEAMEHFIAAVRGGTPTAIFEDPAPVLAAGVPATSQPRQAPGGMNPMMMRQPPPPKGDINKLWELLGVRFSTKQVVWQDYNPYPKASQFPKEFVFVGKGSGADEPFNPKETISSGLQEVLLPFPGSIATLNVSTLEFTELVQTGDRTGTIDYNKLFRMTPFGPQGIDPNRPFRRTNDVYTMAAHIRGEVPADERLAADGTSDERLAADGTSAPGEDPAEPSGKTINVVLVADLDILAPGFFQLREQGEIPEAGVHFNFDNVTFVLNTLDALASDERFLDIRKRRRIHRTLTEIEEKTKDARKETATMRDALTKEFEEAKQEEQDALHEQLRKLEEQMKAENLDLQEILRRVTMAERSGNKRINAKIDRLEQKRDRQINKIETKLALEVREVQDGYKIRAVLLPPIPPLVLALIVLVIRRAREHEGVARSRLR